MSLAKVRYLLVLLLASSLFVVCGCELFDDDLIDDHLQGRARTLEVADTTAGGQPVIVRVAGVVGPDGCYHLDGIHRYRVGRTWVLSPIAHHYQEARAGCSAMVVMFDEILSLEPSDTGWTWIELESSGPLLRDSTYVKPAPSLAGAFSYTAYDSSGLALVNGTLWLEREESGDISGAWDLLAVGNPGEPGPQLGEGIVSGWFEPGLGRLDVNLNPVTPDNSVVLSGVVLADRYTGEWTWYVSYIPKNRGRFVALRMER